MTDENERLTGLLLKSFQASPPGQEDLSTSLLAELLGWFDVQWLTHRTVNYRLSQRWCGRGRHPFILETNQQFSACFEVTVLGFFAALGLVTMLLLALALAQQRPPAQTIRVVRHPFPLVLVATFAVPLAARGGAASGSPSGIAAGFIWATAWGAAVLTNLPATVNMMDMAYGTGHSLAQSACAVFWASLLGMCIVSVSQMNRFVREWRDPQVMMYSTAYYVSLLLPLLLVLESGVLLKRRHWLTWLLLCLLTAIVAPSVLHDIT